METATAAAVQNEGTNSPAVLSHARSATICILSLLFVWLAITTLCHIAPGDEKEKDHLISAAVVCDPSPLVSAYLFTLTVVLQGVKDSATAFLQTTCLLLLAAAVATLIGPTAGAAAMFLVTVHSAIILGRALAVRRQKAGTEVTAVAAAMSSSPYRSRAEERYVQYSQRAVVVSVAIVLVGTSGTWALVTWFSPPPPVKEGESHIGQGELALLSIMSHVGLLLPLTRQLMLNGSPLQVEGDTFFVSMGVGVFVWIVAMVVAIIVGGGNAPGIVSWTVALAMAGYFGYGRAVEVEYEELVTVKRSEPRTAEDASGLRLAGRTRRGGRLFSAYRRVD